MGKTGVGGYGGPSTMNQDDRGPRYGPHLLISRHGSYELDIYYVKCLKCGKKWTHPRYEREHPPHCKVPCNCCEQYQPASEASDLSTAF